ncbi:MAG: CBS domain-containing protein [Candidatus Omnitrophica bacterium]|nr:CBS domain-containing protein [Candidatus Omnitrophota bacterium]
MDNPVKTNPVDNYSAGMFIYFSQLIDREVVDKNGLPAGQVYDIVVKPTEVYPQSYALIIRKGWFNRKYALIRWTDILEIDTKELRLKIEAAGISFAQTRNNKEELTLRRDILDQQVVDTYNHKVIRINDIHLLFVDHSLMAAHVDISIRGLIRRLGLEKCVDILVGMINKNADYLKKEYLISWKHIQPLSINPVSMTIKVDVPQKQFSRIPAADLGEVFLDLNIKHQIALFKSLDLNTKGRIFRNIDFKTQRLLIEELKDAEAVAVLNNIPSDEATDFLEKLPQADVEHFLKLMETKYSNKLSQLLGYSSDSAGGLMTAEFISYNKDTLIEMVLKQIKERTFKVEPAQFVYIVDEANHLVGATNFRHLMLAQPQDPLNKAAFPKTYFVHLNSSIKEVAYLMEKYKYYAVPVVDESNILQGIITVDDILSQVIAIAWRRFKNIKVQPKQ